MAATRRPPRYPCCRHSTPSTRCGPASPGRGGRRGPVCGERRGGADLSDRLVRATEPRDRLLGAVARRAARHLPRRYVHRQLACGSARVAHRPLRRYAVLELAIGALGVSRAARDSGARWALRARRGLAAAASASRLLRRRAGATAADDPDGRDSARDRRVAAEHRARHGAVARTPATARTPAGGVVGCVLAGLLSAAQCTTSTWRRGWPSALNAVVAAASVSLVGRRPRARKPRGSADTSERAPQPTDLRVAALSGMTALAAEVLWTRHLSLLLGGTVYTFALILAVFLAGLAPRQRGRRGRSPHAATRASALAAVPMAPVRRDGARRVHARALAAVLAASTSRCRHRPASRSRSTCCARAASRRCPRCCGARAFRSRWRPRHSPGAAPERVVGPPVRRQHGRCHRRRAADDVRADRHARQPAHAAAHDSCQRGHGARCWRSRRPRARVQRLAAGAVSPHAAVVLALRVPALPPELVAYGRFLPTRGSDANVIYVGEGLTSSIAVSAEPSGILTYHNAGKTQASTLSARHAPAAHARPSDYADSRSAALRARDRARCGHHGRRSRASTPPSSASS